MAKKKSKKKKTTQEKKEIKKEETVVEVEEKPKKEKVVVNGLFAEERVLTEDSDAARELYNQSSYGRILEDGKLQLSLCEALYLMEKGKLRIHDQRKKE